jgi:hypothetical protein
MQDEDIVAELRDLARANGGELRPAEVVRAARDENSPLHRYFCWDDTIAARNYRLHQARQLLRVQVEYLQHDQKAVLARVFVNLPSERKDKVGYRLMSDVLSTSDGRRHVLAEALRELQRIRVKFQNLQELAAIFAAVRQFEEQAESATDQSGDEAQI